MRNPADCEHETLTEAEQEFVENNPISREDLLARRRGDE